MTGYAPDTESRPPRVSGLPSCFTFLCLDGADGTARRSAAIDAHLRFIESVWQRILVAGPLYDPGSKLVGSLYVVAAPDATSARALLEADPFFTAGVWEEIRLFSYTPAAGTWTGGRIWD